jgi:ribosomal protein L32
MSNNNFCKNCGTQFGDSDRFCGSCGTPKVELCPTCGQVWDKDVEEVEQKKSISKPEPIFPKPMPPVQERKPVLIQEPPKPKVETVFAEVKKESPKVVAQTVSGARVQPVYGNLYVPGKDCPNCGEKGQKGKTCSTCKGTF